MITTLQDLVITSSLRALQVHTKSYRFETQVPGYKIILTIITHTQKPLCNSR